MFNKLLQHLAILDPIQMESTCVGSNGKLMYKSNTPGINNDQEQCIHNSALDRSSNKILEHQVQHLKKSQSWKVRKAIKRHFS